MNAELILRIIFWISLGLIFWTYFGYWLGLKVLASIHIKEVKKMAYFPEASLIVAVYNEEKNIIAKVENCLALDYPGNKLEIIVVSDGSTDDTENIVRSFSDRGVKLLALPERQGKHFSQHKGIEIAGSDIMVFSDATTFLEKDAVKNIVGNFADPEIGCVSGLDKIAGADSSSHGEGAYVKYEMKLRALESAVNSLVGVSGSFYAVRKKLCRDWISNMSSDFYLPILAYMDGYRTVLEEKAIGYYRILDEVEKEFARKVRTVVHGMEVLFKFKKVLNPFKYGLYACQMFSHKLSRWLVPLYLMVAFLVSLLLAGGSGFFLTVLLMQIAFYMLALIGYLAANVKSNPIFRIPLFFVMANFSIIIAWYGFIKGRDYVLWEPTRR
jgi:cellulose synthase/poly-beta-1,6-N-acetylglucosamine synthase-like glycosyltransferase